MIMSFVTLIKFFPVADSAERVRGSVDPVDDTLVEVPVVGGDHALDYSVCWEQAVEQSYYVSL